MKTKKQTIERTPQDVERFQADMARIAAKAVAAPAKAQYTPWRVAPYLFARGVRVTMAQIEDSMGNTVAIVDDARNAPMFAAAPALVEALRDLLEYVDAISSPDDNVEKRKARAALALVEGSHD